MQKQIFFAVVKVIFFIAVAVILFLQARAIRRYRSERDTYRRDVEVLMSDIDTFRTKNGELAGRISELELSEKDFKRLLSEDARQITALKRRNEELDRLVKAQMESEISFSTEIRDTIIIVEQDLSDHIRYFHWEDDPWEVVDAKLQGSGVANVNIRHHDEVDVSIFLEYKKFLWWKCKLIGSNVVVTSRNPYTKDIKVSSVNIKN